jgi:hypothetical protein
MGLESILRSHALGYVHFDLKLGNMLWRRKIKETYEAVLSDVKGAKRA